MIRLLPVVLLLLPLPLAAEDIYRSVDEDGNVIYTDKPPSDDAEPVELDPVTTVPAFEGDDAGGNTAGDEEATEPVPAYDSLEITYPTPDEAVRHNGGLVPFELALLPADTALAEGHRIEIVVDGNVSGRGKRVGTVTSEPLERGPHDAFARIVDAGGNVLVRSPAVNFFLLRHSVQQQ